MSEKNQEPKRDFGFYATVPRIVRIKYKDLSHAEKWLYVCLKDLCGDKGTCFRTLRTLSEETDVSTGSLSKMIPDLHKAGLIHAEKKRRSESGKEVWHITIADIWAENAKACSKNEQAAGEVVQNTNKDVQNLNENPQDCSENERDCSNFVDRRNNREVRTSEERTKEERKNAASQQNANVSTQDESSHSFVPSQDKSSPSSSQQQTKPGEKQEVVFTPEAAKVFQLAKDLNLVALKGDEKDRDNCQFLAEKGFTTLEKLESLIEHCRQVSYLQGKALNLKNLVNESSGWLQLHRKSTAAPLSSAVSSSMGVATAEWIAEQKKLQQRILEQEAAQGGNRISLKERQAQLLAGKKPTVGNRHLQPLPTSRREGSHHA